MEGLNLNIGEVMIEEGFLEEAGLERWGDFKQVKTGLRCGCLCHGQGALSRPGCQDWCCRCSVGWGWKGGWRPECGGLEQQGDKKDLRHCDTWGGSLRLLRKGMTDRFDSSVGTLTRPLVQWSEWEMGGLCWGDEEADGERGPVRKIVQRQDQQV